MPTLAERSIQNGAADSAEGTDSGEGTLRGQPRQLKAPHAAATREHHRWKALRLSHSDVGRGGRQLLFGLENIGSPLQEIGGKTRWNLRRDDLGSQRQTTGDRHRSVSEQHTELVFFLHRLLFEIRQLRRGAGSFRLELIEVELRDITMLQTNP